MPLPDAPLADAWPELAPVEPSVSLLIGELSTAVAHAQLGKTTAKIQAKREFIPKLDHRILLILTENQVR